MTTKVPDSLLVSGGGGGGGGGGSGDMLAANNLSELPNKTTARSNLGLGSLATQSGTFSGTSSGTNTGDQTITLSGDLSGSGSAGVAATIANDAVTNAKQANMATKTYKGRTSASTGDPEDVPVATLKADLSLTKSDVGLSNVDNTADANKTVADSVKWNGHNISVSSSVPSGGADGDIWFQYTP